MEPVFHRRDRVGPVADRADYRRVPRRRAVSRHRGAAEGMEYADYLRHKQVFDAPTGLENIPVLPRQLFPFQADIVRWALHRGRAAIFAGTGLGKSLMELAWGNA